MAYVKKEYLQSDAVTQAQQALQNQQQNKPGQYQSQWQNRIQDTLAQIQNRPHFQYDVNSDALYKQVAQNYIRQGKQAMMDTVGQVSALTGGYASSYAQNAGQQAYQEYLQGLNAQIPEFYRMALEKYRMEGEDLLNQYGLLTDQENRDYTRWQEDMDQYYTELDRLQGIYDSERAFDYSQWEDAENFAYGQYRDDVADQQWQTEFDYQQSQDERAYQQWLQQFQYQQEQDKIAQQQWQMEFEESQRRYNQEWAAAQAKAAARYSGSSGKKKESAVGEEEKKAQTFVDNMLKNATSSRFDPERVINGTNQLTSSQKEYAQKYLTEVLKAGVMK